jgi:hypothetical protein
MEPDRDAGGRATMDSNRISQLTTLLTSRVTRRRLVGGGIGAASLGLTPAAAPVAAQDASPVASQEDGTAKTPFLFVQLFDEGTWFPHPDEEGVYVLMLRGAAAQTLYFSDRPDRIVGTLDTVQFLEGLGFTPSNPPNAALVVRTQEGTRDVLVIELFDPVYAEDINDPGSVNVSYSARVLDAYGGDGLAPWAAEQEDFAIAERFEDVSLFIDDCPDLMTCQAWVATNEIDGRWVTYGPIPGGPYGRCFSLWQLACVPCNSTSDYYDNLCNEAYPGCNGRCDTTCKLGGCP